MSEKYAATIKLELSWMVELWEKHPSYAGAVTGTLHRLEQVVTNTVDLP